MDKFVYTVSTEWKREDPDMSECFGCKEVIYGNQYRFFLLLNGKSDTNIVICESCKLIIDGGI